MRTAAAAWLAEPVSVTYQDADAFPGTVDLTLRLPQPGSELATAALGQSVGVAKLQHRRPVRWRQLDRHQLALRHRCTIRRLTIRHSVTRQHGFPQRHGLTHPHQDSQVITGPY